MIRIGLFGASGFIGQNLMSLFKQDGIICIKINVREHGSVESIADELKYRSITHVICAIGKAHDVKKEKAKLKSSYYEANVELPRLIALASTKAEVRQMIYLSSSKVYGDLTLDNYVSERSVPSTLDLYGKTKLDGENTILMCLKNTETLPIIIRMPLVYGKNVKGNLKTLKRILDYFIPLPLRGVNYNRRSLLSVTNLYTFILNILEKQNMEYQIFNVKDEFDYSTFDIVDMLIKANNVKAYIFTLNPRFLGFILKVISKSIEEKLMRNHLICDELARTKLGWKPLPTNLDDFKVER